MSVPFIYCFALKIQKKSHHFFGFNPSHRNFELLADLARAGAMEEGVMVAAGAMEDVGVVAASITPKATRGRKMPKQKRKLGRYASRGKQQQKTSVS